MQFSFFLFAFCFLLFLICLYIFAHDDFVLIRKNISMDKVYDLAFVAIIIGLFFARIFYVVFHFDPKFFNPFIFALFPYHPGLSLFGGVAAAFLYFFIMSKRSKIQTLRLLDFFSLSFIFVLPFWFLINGLLIVSAIFAIFFGIFTYIFRKIKMEEGSISHLALSSFFLVSLVVNIVQTWKNLLFLHTPENYFLIILFIIPLAIFIRQENLLGKLKKLRSD
ncbi:MAG: prolipoprotein diacylglyceryl transferase family protein [Candidatus Levyibacteriota bacterium]